MANSKDVIKLSTEDWKSDGSFKTAPPGKYALKINKSQTKIKPGSEGNVLQLCWTIGSGPHKSINIFDNISPNAGWKVVQILKALGISPKKAPKTLQELLKLVLSVGEMRAVVTKKKWEGRDQNKIVSYLPVGSDDDEDDDEDEDDEEEDDDEVDDDDEDASDDEEEEDEEEDDEEDDDDEDASDDEEEEDEEEDDEEDDDEDEEEDADEEEDDEEDEDDEDEEEDEGEDEDDEDEPVVKRKPAAKKAAAKKTGRKR